MKNFYLIFKKEIKEYFNSPLAYIIMIVFLIISGWLFASTIFLIDSVTIRNFTYNVPVLLMFFAPALAMQLMPEEFHAGTLEILGTLPLKDEEIVLGKVFASFTLLAAAILLTLVFPFSISFFGNVDWGQVTGAYIGMILIGGLFLSFGIFASSVTNNQVVSFIIGFAISFVFFIAGKLTGIMPGFGGEIVGYIGIDSHWESISRGVIDLRNIFYFLSVSGFFVYSSLIIFKKRVRLGFYSFSSAILMAGIIIILNILLSGFVLRADLTQNNIYSLSSASKNMVRELDDPVLVKAYFSENIPSQYKKNKKYLKDILHEYRAYSDEKIKFEFISPTGDSQVARQAMGYGIPPLKFTETGQEKFEVKQGYMGLVIIYSDRTETIPVVQKLNSLEYDLTTKIKKITSGDLKKVGFIGTLAISDKMKGSITERYELSSATAAAQLENYDSVVVRADKNFTPSDLDILKAAFDKNIPIAVFADKYKVNMQEFSAGVIDTGINGVLSPLGVTISPGLILDEQNQRISVTTRQGFFTIQNYVDYPYFPRIAALNTDNPSVKDLGSISLPYVSPLKVIKQDGYITEKLAETSENSWLDADPGYMSPMRNYHPSRDAKLGPFTVGVSIRKKDSPMRAVVFSNSRLFDEAYMVTPSNRALFLNTVDYITQDEDLISIRSKAVSARPLKETTPATKRFVKVLDIFFMPLVLFSAGIYRWKRKEYKNLKKKRMYLDESITPP
ncbi:MAG: Gldg family protein [Elusimicrobia bacterium]|jgi:ABC-type transport system involved in multi-copper enzyme maturation permease subunit|nr:Gldg family protein [Elusimicrobiota bacterium]